jgi:hypothetical protein
MAQTAVSVIQEHLLLLLEHLVVLGMEQVVVMVFTMQQ